jgi:hypothetical protein
MGSRLCFVGWLFEICVLRPWMDENVSDFRSNQSGSWNCTKAKIKNVSEVNGCEVSIFLPYGSEMIK